MSQVKCARSVRTTPCPNRAYKTRVFVTTLLASLDLVLVARPRPFFLYTDSLTRAPPTLSTAPTVPSLLLAQLLSSLLRLLWITCRPCPFGSGAQENQPSIVSAPASLESCIRRFRHGVSGSQLQKSSQRQAQGHHSRGRGPATWLGWLPAQRLYVTHVPFRCIDPLRLGIRRFAYQVSPGVHG